ncbi:MAG: 30S ribosomal protein S8 [Patescibacteria group bacterium]
MYYDLLAKIKNAVNAKKENFSTPFSNFDFEVAKILAANGYLKDVQKKTVGNRNFIEIKINYKNNSSSFNDFKIISRPSRHIYVRSGEVRKVKQGYGLGMFSTTQGILADRDARKKKVGGEYLFEIW